MADFFRGKVVIVTGSSNGIGRETARQFAARGAKVTITGRNADTLKVTKQQCLNSGAKESDIAEVLGDLANDETAEKIIAATIDKFGQIDVLVNNAGFVVGDPEGRKGIEQPAEIYDKIMHINMRSVLTLSQLAVAHLEKTRGAIVNVSSIASYPVHYTVTPYYAVSKAALDQLTVQMASTLIKKGIRVNSVNPGVVRTDIGSKIGIPEDHMAKMYDSIGSDTTKVPLGRAGIPADIAHVILFLADRSLSEFIVGQRIVSDGGTILQNNMMSDELRIE